MKLADTLIPFGSKTFHGKQGGSIAKLNLVAVQDAANASTDFSGSASNAARDCGGCENGFAKKVKTPASFPAGAFFSGAMDTVRHLFWAVAFPELLGIETFLQASTRQ